MINKVNNPPTPVDQTLHQPMTPSSVITSLACQTSSSSSSISKHIRYIFNCDSIRPTNSARVAKDWTCTRCGHHYYHIDIAKVDVGPCPVDGGSVAGSAGVVGGGELLICWCHGVIFCTELSLIAWLYETRKVY